MTAALFAAAILSDERSEESKDLHLLLGSLLGNIVSERH